jgi:hypothetical protein
VIGTFPPPYSDELFYNVIARLFERMRYSSTRAIGEDIFLATSATAVPDLPHRLAQLVSLLPPEFGISTASIIVKNTLWPYWAAFQSPERRSGTQADMASTGHPYLLFGLMASRAPWPRFFRYCPLCVELDRSSPAGETYWHRVHQIPGIEVCATHEQLLLESCIEFRQPRNRFQYCSAEASLLTGAERLLSESERDPRISKTQLNLARSTEWLLSHPTVCLSGFALRERYLWELANHGFATWNGTLRKERLITSFLNYYPTDWLARIGCGISASGETWLERLIHKPLSVQSPLKYLLILDFLDIPIESFLCSDLLKPFGSGPWPCLNRVADHFMELKIEESEVRSTRCGTSLSGTFKCPSCGMTYTRLGPDNKDEDRFRRDRVPAFGPVWIDALKQGWSDPAVSLRKLAQTLGVDPRTVVRQAAGLQLSAEARSNASTAKPSSAIPLKSGPIRSVDDYENEWLKLAASNPGETRSGLRAEAPKIYTFLHRHVPDWLERNSPRRMVSNAVSSRTDWPARDELISSQIPMAVGRLLIRNPPVRLTRTALLREAGVVWAIKKLSQLPKTESILNRSEESRVNFAVRRVEVARSQFSNLEPWRLIRLAGLRPDLVSDPRIIDVLSKTLAPGSPG